MTKHVGILGSGQLARLLALEGIRMGMTFDFWVSSDHSAIQNLGRCFHSQSSSLESFCQQVDAIIIEHEHVPLEDISIIEKYPPYQTEASLLRQTRDRLLEKQLQESLSLPFVPYVHIQPNTSFSLLTKKLGLPFVIKKRTDAYDGKGQHIVCDESYYQNLTDNHSLNHHIAEQFIPFDAEYSLVSVRGQDGSFFSYDLTKNTHKNGILRHSLNIEQCPLWEKAHHINKTIADYCGYVGVFAVEYFYHQGQLRINEISPRVHNSGHWTMDATYCNQFENHLRACLGLPLGATDSHTHISMINVIGSFDDYEDIVHSPLSKFYNYNKESRPNRKLGHINIPLGKQREASLTSSLYHESTLLNH